MKPVWIVLIVVGLLAMALSFPWPGAGLHICLADRIIGSTVYGRMGGRGPMMGYYLSSYGLIWMAGIVLAALGVLGLIFGRNDRRKHGRMAPVIITGLILATNPLSRVEAQTADSDRVKLSALIEEAMANNPEVNAAREAARSAGDADREAKSEVSGKFPR